MHTRTMPLTLLAVGTSLALAVTAAAQIGRRFPSEKRIVPDPVTGVPLTFLTQTPGGGSKIYPTHPQWTSDSRWLVFRSGRVPGEALAVNEETGAIVQVTEGGYVGMLCVARLSMRLYLMRPAPGSPTSDTPRPAPAQPGDLAGRATAASSGSLSAASPTPSREGPNRVRGPLQIVEIDLARVLADSEAGTLRPPSAYERICGSIPAEMKAGGDMALDAREDVAYFRIGGPDLASRLPAGTKIAEPFGPRGMGAGPSGLASMDLASGAIAHVVAVPFQIGHVQANPWLPGEIVFCWETGGKSPQRTWTVMADGSGLRPLYPEAPHEWVTHEAVITRDEVAIAILGHRRPGASQDEWAGWGAAGATDHPTGLGIVDLRTREMRIAGQVPAADEGRSVWHVHGSADGRWAVGDDFLYRLWLFDRRTGERALLADAGHVTTAADHLHPTFSPDGTRIEIQSAMLSDDRRSLNICVVPVPRSWLSRTYTEKIVN